jgi:hypothetical protein
MDPELWELIEQGDSKDEIAAIARLSQPNIAPRGVRVIAQLGDIATIRVERGRILKVRADEAVTSLKTAAFGLAPDLELDPGEPPEDFSELLAAASARRPPSVPETGCDVCVGIVDWGLDFAHPDFRHKDGSTRILALWDQRPPPSSRSPQPYGYGVVHTSDDINRALAAPDPYAALGYHPADADLGRGCHGTLVASIAAGNGRGSGAPGVATGAHIIFVHLSVWGRNELEKLGDSVTLLEAVHFIARTADKRPWVINLSMGRQGESHDAHLPVVQGLDALLRSAPGGCIVQSCGNYFDRGMHASGQLRPAEERILVWEIKEGDITPNELEVWYPGRDVFDVEIRSPDGSVSARAALGEQASLTAGGRKIGTLYNRAYEPNTLDNQIEIILYAGGPAGAWELVLIGKDVTDGRFHCWIERDVCSPCQSRFRPEDAVSSFTTGTICNGRRTIAVGAYNPHSPGRELARFSSCGPTRDGREKPDCIAPGVSIVGARSAPRDQHANAPLLTAMSGTSFAAPCVTGTVALMFEAAKQLLRIEQTHNLLLANMEHVTGSEEILNRVGSGYLDIAKAVEAARNVASGGPLFRPYVHGKMGEAAVNDENTISSTKSDGTGDRQSLEEEADADESNPGEATNAANLVREAGSLKLRIGEKTRFVLELAPGIDCTWAHFVEGPSGVVEVSIGGLSGLPSAWGSTSGAGYSLVTITAWAPGQVKVHFICGQPWMKDRPPEKEEVLEISVQNADDGISPGLASPSAGTILARPGEEEAAKRNDRFGGPTKQAAASPQFQIQVPISGGGAPALALPVGGSGSPFALTVPLGGTTPTAPPPVVGQTGSPVPPQPASAEPQAAEPAVEPALSGMEPAISGNDKAAEPEPRGTDFGQEQPFESPLIQGRDAAEFVELADQAVAERTAARAPLEILSPMAVLHGALPRAAVAESLISPGSRRRLSAAELFDAFAYPGREALRDRLERDFEVVALPRAPLDGTLRPGDLLFRRGEGGLGHLSVIASPELRNYEALLSEGLTPEVIGPGNYAQVIETGVRPHTLSDAFARQITDAEGRLPYDQLVLRLREDAPPAAKIQAHIQAASPVVVVKKSYTSPARQSVTLRADAGFMGNATFDCSKKKTIQFYKLAAGGKKMAFDGKDNVFTDNELTAKDGVKLFAEGVTASTAVEDVVLTLKLAPAPGPAGAAAPVGPPATAKMTAVEVNLDICTTETTPGKDLSPLRQPPAIRPAVPNDKWFAGRPVGFRGKRALLIVRAKPAAFAGTLVLRQVKVAGDTITGLDTKAQLFDSPTAKKNPHEFSSSASDQRFFVEGATVSGVLRDTGFQLGIKGVDDDGDRIALTVFSVDKIEAKLRATPCRRDGSRADIMPAKSSTADSKTFDATAITVVKECGDLHLTATVRPAAIPITWDRERAADDTGLTGLPMHGPDPASPASRTDNKKRVLKADGTGSFHVHAFVDVNGNGKRGDDEDGIILNVNMVKIEILPLPANNRIITRDTLYTAAGSDATFLTVDSGDRTALGHPVNTMYADALFNQRPLAMRVDVKLTGGGGSWLRGVDKVALGYIQNFTGDNFHGTYADGKTEKEVFAVDPATPNPITGPDPITHVAPALLGFPIRDMRPGVVASNGTVPFMTNSTDAEKTLPPGGGQQRVVKFMDRPEVSVHLTHPVSGANLTGISGSNSFVAFLCAFSADFDENYTVFARGNWSLTFGTFTPAAGWSNAGAHPAAAAAMDVTGMPMTGEKAQVERCPPNSLDNLKMDAR